MDREPGEKMGMELQKNLQRPSSMIYFLQLGPTAQGSDQMFKT
jgi:hypothetical protein